jgi:alpha 1,3-glucosidase
MYTQFLHANLSGTPILRPIWYEFPKAEGISHREHIFMVGPSLLVVPALQQGQQKVTVSLPESATWYDAKTGSIVAPNAVNFRAFQDSCTLDEGPRAYLRGGTTMITKERRRRSSEAMAKDPYTLYVALNLHQKAEGDLYIDDGRSYAFQKGKYVYKRFEFEDYVLSSKSVQLPEMAVADASFRPTNAIERIVVLGMAGGPRDWVARLNGVELEAGPGKMFVGERGADVAFVIRKPAILAADDWEISFSKVTQ